MEAPEGCRQSLRRARLLDPVPDLSPEAGLPSGMVGQGPTCAVDQPASGPLPHHVRTVQVVAVEQVGDAPAPGIERGALARPGPRRQAGGEPGRPVGGGDGIQHRPHHPLDAPRIGLAVGPVHGQHGVAQVARIRPDDVGGDAVAGTGSRGAKMTGQLEGEPASHPVGRHRQPLGREGVRGCDRQDLGQSSRQGPGRARRVQMDHRPATLVRGCDNRVTGVPFRQRSPAVEPTPFRGPTGAARPKVVAQSTTSQATGAGIDPAVPVKW